MDSLLHTSDSLYLQEVYPVDSPQIEQLLAPLLKEAPYSSPMGDAEIQDQIFHPTPPFLHDVQWIQHTVLGAWRQETLFGFIELGTGHEASPLHEQGTPHMNERGHAVGLLRFLAFAPDYRAEHTVRLLLDAADSFWQRNDVRRVRAFSIGLGYAQFQSGAGVLPGHWEEHFRWLTGAGYRLLERYYCMRLPLQRMVVEQTPVASYSLWPQRQENRQEYQVYSDDEPIAMARLLIRHTIHHSEPIAYINHLEVLPKWRKQGIGRWLLRRLVNDAYQLGCAEIALHVNHSANSAHSLLTQLGFEERNYRGYSLEKRI